MAKYNRKGKESSIAPSTESLIEISGEDFNDGGDELNSDSSSMSLKEITAGDFNHSYKESSSESFSDSSSESLREISAEDFKDGSRISSRPKVRVNNRQNLNFFWSERLEIDLKKDEVEKEDIDMLVEENVSDSEKEEFETELSLEDDKRDRKVKNDLEAEENSTEIDEFDKKVGLVLEELESILDEEVKMSFEEACLKLQRCYINLNQMSSEGHKLLLHKLAKQAFMGTQTLYSAYSSRSLKNMDQNKELLLRVLLDIKNQYSISLTDEQLKEIDAMVCSLASEAVGKSKKDPRISSFMGNNNSRQSLFELPTDSRTDKVTVNPLLNLYEDYFEGSLPSPTHNNASPLPALKPTGYETQPAPGPAQIMSTGPIRVNENGYKIHPYVIDALKAVSSYQQKHIKNSSDDFSQLQSPTPSDDGKDDKDDTCSEASSSFVATSAGIVGPTSASVHTNYKLGISQMTSTMPCRHDIDVGHDSVTKSSGSRDSRIGFMDPEGSSIPQNGNMRKHKAVDDLVSNGHNVKRQRNESAERKDVKVSVGGNTWLEDNCVLYHINKINELHENVNGLNGATVPSVSSSTVCVVSSPSGLKDSEIKPTIFMQIVKEQPSLAAIDQENAAVQVVNGTINMLSATLDIEKKLIANPQINVQTSAMNLQSDTEKNQTKPRDPRRILLDVVQKCESPVSQSIKPTVSQPPDLPNKTNNLITPRPPEEDQSVALHSQSSITHDSLIQFKNDADNITDKESNSPTSNVTQRPELAIAMPKNKFVDTAKLCADMEDLLGGHSKQQKPDIQKETARRIAEQTKMFAAHKLCLVLDLDHTLLNSAMFGEVDSSHGELLRKREVQDKKLQERHLYCLPHMGMWTKLRPGVRNFLKKASKLYELHVYTMGNKKYATEMTKILDPQGTLFSGRVISGGDDDENTGGDDRVTKIKGLDGVLGMESSVVIIDDTVRVWPHHKLNLIAVERYMYFPSSRRQFGLNGPSLLELNLDERPEHGTLASSLAVIERVHQIFFSHKSLNEVDVRTILAMEQRKILAGCKILFSRVIPLGEANPHLHPLWQTAEQFGAECTNEIDERVTHVVAISKGTDKVKWALATGRFVVHPGWVEASTLLYRRAKEQDFIVKK